MTLAPGVHDTSSYGFRWERNLEADLEALVHAGASVLVSLLEESELARYAIQDLYPSARKHGLEVLRMPIPDGGLPRSLVEVDELLDAMESLEAKGAHLVIHCRGGLGRTGTIAGCYLVRNGHSAAEALAIVSRARKSDRCPENKRQREFVAEYAVWRRRAVSPTTPAAQTAPSADASAWYVTALAGLGSLERAVTAKTAGSQVAALLAEIEREVSASPESCFSFAESGEATLTAAGRSFAAGRFTTPTLGELRSRVTSRSPGGGRVVLSVLHGAHALTDIGTLQATAPAGTLFQVASQFNCLEATGPRVVPVRDYLHDSTQGPRASISAFPGTYLLPYRASAPDGSRFVQTDKRCVELLASAVDPAMAEVRSGYLQSTQVRDMPALATALVDRFAEIRVGVHAGVEVVFGYDWGGPLPSDAVASPRRISQVFTSTIALGGYSRDDGSPALAVTRRQLLRAAYLGTLLAALDLGCDTVVLTMIGGGVFGNSHRDIWDAIHWAIDEVEPLANGTKQVVVNTREEVAAVDRERIRARGGAFVEFGGGTIEVLR